MSLVSTKSGQLGIWEGVTPGSSLGTFKRYDRRCLVFFIKSRSFPEYFSVPKLFLAHLKTFKSDTSERNMFIEI